jgi:hypothetical protein
VRCFYHHDREAIGMCKSCSKGLCPDCAVDLNKGLACKDYCEEEVKGIIALIDQNVAARAKSATILNNARANTYMQAALIAALSIGLIAMGQSMIETELFLPPTLLGLCLLAFSGYILYRAIRFPR